MVVLFSRACLSFCSVTALNEYKSWLLCTLFLIQNHEILNFILPKANFLERVILRAMKHFLGFGQGLKTFPPLFELLAMRHRAQLISDGVHTFTILHKVQKVHILCLWKFRSDSIVQLARGIPFTNYHCGVPLGLTPVVPLMQFTRTCWPRDNRIIKKGSFGLLFYQLEAAFQEWAHIFQYCGYNIVVTILWLQHCDHDIVST